MRPVHRAACAVALLLLAAGPATAQKRASEPLRPRWLQKAPRPTNPSFTYTTESATAPTLEAARERCLAELVAHAGLANGVVCVSNNDSRERLSQVWENGRLTERILYDSRTDSRMESDAVTLHVENVAEYWERDRSGNYLLTKLFARSTGATAPLFDHIVSTTRYGARGLWRSAVIPGWGQFHKGANLKGGLILGGCAALAAGIVFTESQRSDYIRKMGRTHDTGLIRRYSTRADHYATARNVCIGAAAALYLYNLIDAVSAPGARRLIVRNGNRPSYALAPTFTGEGTPVMAASVVF